MACPCPTAPPDASPNWAPLTAAPSTAARKSGFPRMAVGGDEIVLAWTVPGEPSQVRTARIPLEAL